MSDKNPVVIRSATIEGVSYPERTMDLLVVPYDEWTEVHEHGRTIEESVAPGAFGAIRNRARRFLVNMEHDEMRWVGTVQDLDPDHKRGMRATIKVRRTAEGDQALDDAADGFLGASIGMAFDPKAQSFDGKRRRIVKAFLDHVALTATPAYVGAEVLAVRTVQPLEVGGTPNLDRVLSELAELGYSRSLS